MARRVNIPFVIGLVTALVLTAGLVVAALYYVNQRSGREARGDLFLEQGRERMQQASRLIREEGLEMLEEAYELRRNARELLGDALHEFQAAIAHDPQLTHIRYKQYEAMTLMAVDNRQQLRSRHASMERVLRDAFSASPSNESFSRWMELLLEVGHLDGVHSESRAAIDGQPGLWAPRLYRAIAQVQRNESRPQRDADAWQRAGTDLEAVRDQQPDHALAAHYLGRWHAAEAQRLEEEGEDAQVVQSHRDEALRLLDESWDALEADTERRIRGAWVLVGTGHMDEARQRLLAIGEELKRSPQSTRDVLIYLELVRRLPEGAFEEPADQVDSGEHRQQRRARMRRVLDAALKAMPESVGLRFQQAMMMQQQGDAAEAVAALRHIYEQRPVLPPREAATAFHHQQRAGLQLAEAMVAEAADPRTDARRRQAALEEAGQIIESVRSEMGESLELRLVRGHLKLLRGEHRRALSELQPVVTELARGRDGRRYMSALRLLAHAAQAADETGVAVDALQRLHQMGVGDVATIGGLAELKLRMRDFDEAERLLDLLVEHEDQVPQLRHLRARLYYGRGQHERVVELFEPRADEIDGLPRRLLIESLVELDRGERAAELLQQHLERRPDDADALKHFAARFAGAHPQQSRDLIERAREAGVSQRDLREVEMIIRLEEGQGPLTEEEVRDFQAARRQEQLAQDPVGYHLGLWRQWLAQGRLNEAEDALEAAIEAAGDDGESERQPRLVEARMIHALQTGDLEAAQELVSVARQSDIDGAGGRVYEAQLLMLRGRHEQAARRLEEAVERVRVSSAIHQMLGDAYMAMGELERATQTYRTAIAQRPNNIQARLRLAEVLERRGQGTQAIDAVRQAIDLQPDMHALRARYVALAQRFGRVDQAIDMLRSRIERNPQDVSARRLLIDVLARHNQLDEARRLSERLLEEHPGNVQYVAQLARVRAMEGDVEEGRRLLAEHLRERGDDVGLRDWLALAQFLQRSGDLEGAERALVEARAHDDESATAQRQLAALLAQRGHHRQAERMYRDLIERFAQDIGLATAFVSSLIAQQRFDEARQVLDELREGLTEPQRVAAASQFNLSEVQLLLARAVAREQEAAAYRERGQRDPAEAARRRASQLQQSALERIEQVLSAGDIAPQSQARIRLERARILLAKGQRDEALHALRRAVDIAPDFDQPYLLRAQALAEHGSVSAAVEEVQALLSRQPEHEQARKLLARLFNQRPDRYDSELGRHLMESARMYPLDPFWPTMQGRQAVRQGRHDRAVRFFRQRMEMGGGEEAVADLATSLLALDRAEEAWQVVTAHPDLLRQSALLLAIQGHCLLAMERSDQAARSFELAVRQVDGLGSAAAVLRRMREALGLEGSIALLDQVAPVDSGRHGAVALQLNLATMLNREGEHPRAVDRFEQLQRIVPEGDAMYMVMLQGMAEALHHAGRTDAALAAYDRILRISPDDMAALNNSAFLMARDPHLLETALERARRAAEMAPRNFQVLDTLGYLQYLLGKSREDEPLIDEARQTLRRSMEIQESPHNLYHLGLVEMHLERRSVARQLFERAVRAAQSDRSTYAEVIKGANEALAELRQ